MKQRLRLLVILSLAGSCLASAQRTPLFRTKLLDSLISSRLSTVAPGCAVLVAEKGRIVYKKAFGSANLELQVAMRPDMLFRIGSITKQYTAIAILQMMEQGKIALTDPIQKFIPDYPRKAQAITIEHLLTHTSGIPDYEVMNFPIPNAIRVDIPAKQLIDSLGQLTLEFTPGAQFRYSNSNYFLLGYILEQVSGLSYSDYLDKNLLTPAGCTHTRYDSPTDLIPGRVAGYSGHEHHFTNAGYISMTQVFSAGALLSNVEDMLRWHHALDAGKLVSKATLKKAFTPFTLADGQSTQYGYGWIIKKRNGSRSIEHGGGIDGFQSDEIYFPDEDIFIATLYNALNEGGEDVSYMALDNDIATVALGQGLAKELHPGAATLKPFVGVYESDPAHPAVITLENGQLQMEAKAGGLPKSPLVPKSSNRFLLKAFDAEIEFVSIAGKVTGLVVHVNGQTQTAKKVR